MTLDVLTSDLIEGARHGFFTRRGGASSGIYAGLNCGPGSKDQREAVALNRARVAETLGVPPARLLSLHQVHGTEVVTAGPEGWTERPRADAAVTADPTVALSVLTADCAPILLHDPEARVSEAERKLAPGRAGLAEAVARGYYKLLAYKDEYEVARLFTSPAFDKALSEQFESHRKLEFHLAPPLLARRDKATGEPRKMRFGAWMRPVFRLLAKGKRLRGTSFDIFSYSAERKLERQMIADYEKLVDELIERLSPTTHARAVALATLPLEIKGFGHIKERNYKAAMAREAALLAELRNPSPTALKAAE